MSAVQRTIETQKRTHELAIKEGTYLLNPDELAPRLGLKGVHGKRTVIARAKAGTLPCYRPNARTFLFHWPTVEKAINKP